MKITLVSLQQCRALECQRPSWKRLRRTVQRVFWPAHAAGLKSAGVRGLRSSATDQLFMAPQIPCQAMHIHHEAVIHLISAAACAWSASARAVGTNLCKFNVHEPSQTSLCCVHGQAGQDRVGMSPG